MASYVSTFTGDGSEVHFTAGFPVLRLTDLAVVVDNVWLTLGTDYSVSGSTSAALATLVTAPAVGAVVTLRSAVGYTPTDPAAVTTAAPTLNDTDTALWAAIGDQSRSIGDQVYAEYLGRSAADAAIIASGATPADVGIAPVIATGSTAARTVADRFADIVNVKDFGAVGDWNGATGTDNTNAIQAAIDYALENSISTVFVPDGSYLVSDTIHLGYGIGYSSIVLEGSNGYGADGSPGGSGRCRIVTQMQDRPIVNIQGGRRSGLRRIWLDGLNTVTTPWGVGLAYAADGDNYVYAGAKDDPQAPFCGVCIDGYSGTTPANPYPRPPYPAFYGAAIPAVGSEYGRNYSSEAFVTECDIRRVVVGVCIQPNADGNGDFTKLANTSVMLAKVGVSAGNVNCRSVDWTNFNFNIVHTMIDTRSYGRPAVATDGNFAGNLSNLHASQCWQILNVGMNSATPVVFTNYYSENTARIGVVGGAGAELTFVGCNFQLYDTKFSSGTTISEEYSTPIIEAPPGEVYSALTKFIGCNLDLPRAVYFFLGAVSFQNCRFTPFVFFGDGYYKNAREQAALEKMLLGVAAIPDVANQGMTPQYSNCRMQGNATGSTYAAQTVQDGVDLASQSGGLWARGVGVNGFLPYLSMATLNSHAPGATFLPEADRVLSGAGFKIETTDTFFDPGDLLYMTTGVWFYLDTITDLGGGDYELQWNALVGHSWTAADGYTMLYGIGGTAYYYPIGRYEKNASSNRAFKTTAGSADVEYVDGAGTSVTIGTTFTDRRKLLWRGANSLNGVLPLLPFKTANTVINSISGSTVTMSTVANVTGWWADAPGIALIKLGT